VLARQAADLIERSQAEEALREADRRKDEFLAMLGHELRNPLGIISTSMQILRRLAPPDSKTEQLSDTIERQVIHTSRMLDDLLDVSRISRGKIQLNKQRWDFRDVVRQTVEDHRGSLNDSGLRLELYVPDQRLPILGDRTRLSQALGNLLHNAGKFTDKGGVVTVKLESDNLSYVVVSVADTGMGMEPQALGWVFEPFRQADRTLDRSRGGSGLGLALVKGLIEVHNGLVTAASDGPGRGSTFTIQLPLDQAESLSEKAAMNSKNSLKLRVLVIEDNPVAAQNIQRLLEMSGHIVETAHSGPQGVEVAHKFRPEIVLCDIGLPGMDGYEVAQVLRQQVGLHDAFLIAVSGYRQDERRAREVGFNAHILKPVNFDALENMLSELNKDRTVQVNAPAQTQ
jgi:CheY-like chemotaxis protein/nitrogen-specific signal transduction histidine kinase